MRQVGAIGGRERTGPPNDEEDPSEKVIGRPFAAEWRGTREGRIDECCFGGRAEWVEDVKRCVAVRRMYVRLKLE